MANSEPARVPTLETLPVEVLDQVWECLPRSDLKRVSRTIQSLRTKIVPCLFRKIAIWGDPSFEKLQLISENEVRAASLGAALQYSKQAEIELYDLKAPYHEMDYSEPDLQSMTIMSKLLVGVPIARSLIVLMGNMTNLRTLSFYPPRDMWPLLARLFACNPFHLRNPEHLAALVSCPFMLAVCPAVQILEAWPEAWLRV